MFGLIALVVPGAAMLSLVLLFSAEDQHNAGRDVDEALECQPSPALVPTRRPHRRDDREDGCGSIPA